MIRLKLSVKSAQIHAKIEIRHPLLYKDQDCPKKLRSDIVALCSQIETMQCAHQTELVKQDRTYQQKLKQLHMQNAHMNTELDALHGKHQIFALRVHIAVVKRDICIRRLDHALRNSDKLYSWDQWENALSELHGLHEKMRRIRHIVIETLDLIQDVVFRIKTLQNKKIEWWRV